jgi:hypothetical protein
MKIGRVCVKSISRSTVTDEENGYFFKEYIVDLEDKDMVKTYKRIASQDAWEKAISIAYQEGEFYGCSSYPDADIKVKATSDRRGSNFQFNEKELNKSYKYIKSLSKRCLEELEMTW